MLVVGLVAVVAAYEAGRQTNAANPGTSTTPPAPVTSASPGSTRPGTPSTSGVVQPGNPATLSSCAFQQGLFKRECGIAAPPDVKPGERLPAVILLPGLGTGPVAIRDAGDWSNAAVRHRLLVVTPQGIADSWNAGGCCAIAQATGVDDIGYLTKLLDQIAARPDVDPSRIFMAGFSNGGMMTYRFLCSPAGSRLAGAASVSGTNVSGCDVAKALPFEHIHGTGDQVVPYNGGRSLASFVLGVTFPAVAASMAEFARAEGCPNSSATSVVASITYEDWTGCSGHSKVRFVTIPGATHDWPRGAPFDATDELLRFFGIEA